MRWSEHPFKEWQSADLKITHGDKITAIKFSADNETLAVGFSDGHVMLYPMSSGHTRVLARGHDGANHDLLWMPDKRTLTTAGNDGAVVLWDIEQEEIRLRLEVLDLSGTKISGLNLSPIGSLASLRELRLRALPVTDAVMVAVTSLRLLTTFDVRDTAVTAEAVRSFLANRPTVGLYVTPQLFGPHPQLEALLELGPILGEITVDDKPLPPLAAIATIQNGGSITGLTWPRDRGRSAEDLPFLGMLPKLERIKVPYTAFPPHVAIPKVHFPLLAKISSLRSLDLAISIGNVDDLELIGSIEQLRSLTIGTLSDEGLKRIQKLQSLDTLHVTSRSPTLDKLAKAFPRLRDLTCPAIEAKSLANAIPFLESLESLTVKTTRTTPTNDVWPILAQLKKLKQLNVIGSVTDSNFKLILEALPEVQVLKKK